jgi:lipoprotein-anchoring transpeptidase ErfK/SrfK
MNRDLMRGRQAVEKARQAFREGDHRQARRWAAEAVHWAADNEESWLWLAAVASPRASVEYLQRALEINPSSQKAQRGMQWALKRLDEHADRRGESTSYPTVKTEVSPDDLVLPGRPEWARFLPLAAGLLVLVLALAALASGLPQSAAVYARELVQANGSGPKPAALQRSGLVKETRTPTPTPTYTPTLTFTPTSTFTPTPTYTPSPTPTDTPTPTPTATSTPEPTDTPVPVVYNPAPAFPGLPAGVGEDEAWIDVNLTTQYVHAYVGEELVNSFLVSTGTWRTPTVTGQFRIYVKYRYADMSGPGYYLPDVPYVMYFYKGYGLHGTYWHSNFGTPMSHGCINLRTDEAGWLFDFASVGTVVNIHY